MRLQLQKFVSESSIEEEVKNLWNACIDGMPEEDMRALLNFVDGDFKNFELLTDNLIEKSKIGNSSDNQVIESIMESEKKILEMFINGEDLLPSE